jgi:Phage integrase family
LSWNQAGISDVRFYDIRHTCVTLLLDLKVPPHIVREIVGHSDIEVTMTICARASLDEKQAALRKLGEALGRVRCCQKRDADNRWGGLAVREGWSGAGSNRRPSAFQADARTN